MTEIKWLIEMLMNNKLSPQVKDKFIARIGEVEEYLSQVRPQQQAFQRSLPPTPNQQSPSTQKILDEMAQEQGSAILPLVPPQIMAQTPAAAQALIQRQAVIAQATLGSTEVGRKSPRKF